MAVPDRRLFESEAVALYERILESGRLAMDDPSIAPGAPEHAGHALLLEMGLLSENAAGTHWEPVDPATVQSQVVSPLGQRGAELLAESALWAQAFTGLSQQWRRSPDAARGPYTELRGNAIEPFIAALVADAQSELLTAQPQTGRSHNFSQAIRRDVDAIKRGVKMRTLYQHAARRGASTHKYVQAMQEAGGEVRTLDEFFNRLIVVDRRVALFPSHTDRSVAMAVREPAMVAYLVDIFERHWERGRPFVSGGETVARAIAAEQRAMTIRMLIEGHADSVSAKRLGVSPRTYAGYVAELKEEFEVDSRFQLGYALARAGISGGESDRAAPDESDESGGADMAAPHRPR